jgi:hypothetical protein
VLDALDAIRVNESQFVFTRWKIENFDGCAPSLSLTRFGGQVDYAV